jgi:putative transposase
MNKELKMEFGSYYHIYNQGNNKEKIFKEERNYYHFLNLFNEHLASILDLYVYCLLPNHFHFLVRIKKVDELYKFKEKVEDATSKNQGHRFISQKFSNFFNAYTKSINSSYNRTGSLFRERFGRVEIDSDEYFTNLVYYIHANPQKHGYVEDFREYKWSSYHEILMGKSFRVKFRNVIKWFGGIEEFRKFHERNPDISNLNGVVLE